MTNKLDWFGLTAIGLGICIGGCAIGLLHINYEIVSVAGAVIACFSALMVAVRRESS